MIFGLKSLTNLSILLVLVGINNPHPSAIAKTNNQTQLLAQRPARTVNSQPHKVFQPILPKLKQKSQIKILLPKYIPESDGTNPIYAIIETSTPKKYDILLGFSPDCTGGTACRLGVVSAEAVTGSTPRLTGKRVNLARGIAGYFVDFSCGANCSDATLTWRQQGVQYSFGLKAGDRNSLIKMANSAINP
ncbi:hypothetical protein [Anabaena sp. CCY 9910]|uniref:hypothetical protein n=1 Tax=Anabaena sp. CCY 9910 TaxID=3103870 RepID=UPI0039E08538